jgi:hypothetical protein
LSDIDGVSGLVEIAGIVQRDEQRQMLEFEPVDEGDGCGVLAHGKNAVGRAVWQSGLADAVAAVRFGFWIAQSQQRIERLSIHEL